MYVNVHSYYSFNYGTMSIEELLQYAQSMGVTCFALTDINNTSGHLDFLRLAPKYGIKPVLGIEFKSEQAHYIGIAHNNQGLQQLNELLTLSRAYKQAIPNTPPELDHASFIYPWKPNTEQKLRDNDFIGVAPHQLNNYKVTAKPYTDKHVVWASVSFRNKYDFNTHRLLRAIHLNTLLSKLPRSEEGLPDDRFYTSEQIQNHYQGIPQIIERTEQLLNRCSYTIEFGKNKNWKHFTGSHEQDKQLLYQLAGTGIYQRYQKPKQAIKDRLAHELQMICELGFASYFLINWDIVKYANNKGFYHVGRGSGANSLVAYCIGITDVDPVELDLYFERFINPARKNPPDFDIDFSHKDRDDIRNYIFTKYKGHTALLATYSTFERKSCIRELGRVFGLPDGEIDKLQTERTTTKDLDNYGKLVVNYAQRIHGLPNLLSIHACGVLISELPITQYSALELLPVGFPSVQFSMLEAEDVGLYKFDILSQRGLGHIRDAVELVKQRSGEDVPIHEIQTIKEDSRIKELLRTGNTIGCFYVESPAMRQLLRKLLVTDYLGLVAASSVIRPGVSSSGMMHEYISRFRDPEKRKEAHPKLLEILPETFGVMVYQEDVMKVAHIYADLTREESDIMRRGMSGKFRSREEFQRVKDKFFENCKVKGYPDEEAQEVWRQIGSFAGYSFAKGHSASFAVESFQSLFLRAYYPVEFMVGILNNFGGFYTTEYYLHEAKMIGANIELPCINHSNNLFVLQGSTIYIGFCMIKDLGHETVRTIEREREQHGTYLSLNDFLKRVSISLQQLRILIKIQAFRFTGESSKALLWEAHLHFGEQKKLQPVPELFATEPDNAPLPELEYGEHEEAINEIQILGFPLTSPFSLLKKTFKGTTYAHEFKDNVGNVVYIVGYTVNTRPVRTAHGQRMYFGCFIDSKGQLFDTVHFPLVYDKYPFKGKGCYLLKGTIQENFDVPALNVSHMELLPWAFG